ncbi:MAG TPA: DUF389 domain-containing protein [Smithellaceae bacterium]|jgi:uncharacterized hydrophobic protein (TIGR00271 family)|nr:DUF389 domain-containing protein [Smithellaceae bacterium]HPL67882.1 DUF389 domain-containing protein [Smithellaceae bacterium]HQG66708.1 DUF389 domain-containing protein [Smithella sp.]
MIRKLLHSLSLDSDIDDCEKIHATIEKDIIFKGTNLWILAFAIIVACVGLNVNSTAVIIGAMLISPLMGPINGMGYSLATYNFPLFRRSARNFAFAVAAGLIASTVYFTISPVSSAHSELLARTSPTIYDVLIALFGGLAGIVAISSKSKGNVIPGVAIATALMPPLCTAGYGLGTGQFPYFFGAFYLFTINTVFIALSSVAVSQVLNFPIRTLVDDAKKSRINRMIMIVILITTIPSIYFGYGLVQKEAFLEKASKFTRNVSIVEGNYLLKDEVDADDRTITLIYGGSTLSEMQKSTIKEKAKDFSLDDAKVVFKQGFSIDDVKKRDSQVDTLKDVLKSQGSQVDTLKGEINRLNMMLKERDKLQEAVARRAAMGKQLLTEIKPLYPKILACTYSEASTFRDGVKDPERTDVIVFKIKRASLKRADRQKISRWLESRLDAKNVKVFYEN